MKKCICCLKTKSIDEYYSHSKMSDGRLNKCKDCVKKYASKRLSEKMKIPEFVIKEKSRLLEKDRRLYRRKDKPLRQPLPRIHEKTWKNFFEKYPEKYEAIKISQRIKSKTKGNHMHHWSYKIENAKDMIDISQKDHVKAHKNIIYNQELMCYTTLANEILDTKEKHINYLITLGIKINHEP